MTHPHPSPSSFKICVIPDRTGLKSVPICEICGTKNNHREKKNLWENKKASEIFRNLRLLIKEGGYLLSRIALQYHRRK